MISGFRVHLSGSAARNCDGRLLKAAHAYVRAVCQELIDRGGGLVLGVGGEPVGTAALPCLFDWTALEVIADAHDPSPHWPGLRPERFVVVASQRALEKIPAARVGVWDRCLGRPDFAFVSAPRGWRMAGIIRERQVQRGDILLALGGGAGVEHLAELYCEEGKPIIPVYAELGAYNDDGNGGSNLLHGRALAEVDAFVRLRDGAGSAAGKLTQLRLAPDGDTPALARRTADLLEDLRPRPAFYVRLLATDHPDFEAVERYFREVVDHVVRERSFSPYEMGRDRPEMAFMNVEIFQRLHRAGLVVVDLTGVRPNCTMELGYGLGRSRRVVISARKGTELPFDQDKLPTHLWEDGGSVNERRRAYRDWFDRYSELPPIVEPQRL